MSRLSKIEKSLETVNIITGIETFLMQKLKKSKSLETNLCVSLLKYSCLQKSRPAEDQSFTALAREYSLWTGGIKADTLLLDNGRFKHHPVWTGGCDSVLMTVGGRFPTCLNRKNKNDIEFNHFMVFMHDYWYHVLRTRLRWNKAGLGEKGSLQHNPNPQHLAFHRDLQVGARSILYPARLCKICRLDSTFCGWWATSSKSVFKVKLWCTEQPQKWSSLIRRVLKKDSFILFCSFCCI